MNKTYLALAGTAISFAAAGAGVGYFFTKRHYEAVLDEKISDEVEKTKKYFSVLLMEAQNKPADPADIPAVKEADEEQEPEELTPQDLRTLNGAQKAMTSYQTISPTTESATVTKNIFTDTNKPKKKLPPRDPQTGTFVKQTDAVREKEKEETPYQITHEEFLLNEPEHQQENLLFFVRENTLIQVFDNETVDIDLVGEVNLTLFPQVPKDEPSIICVRNEGLEMDYEIKRTHESLTEYMGLGEDEEEIDTSGRAERYV